MVVWIICCLAQQVEVSITKTINSYVKPYKCLHTRGERLRYKKKHLTTMLTISQILKACRAHAFNVLRGVLITVIKKKYHF